MLGFFKRLIAQEREIRLLQETVNTLAEALDKPHPILAADTLLIETADGYRVFKEVDGLERLNYSPRSNEYVL